MGWRKTWPEADAAADHLGVIGWSPDYQTPKLAHPFGSPQDEEERRILEIVRKLRPGQELRVVRDELGGPLGFRVYDVIGDPA